MMNTSNAAQTITARNSRHFDDQTALHLSQAFNQETQLEHLLALLFSQLATLCDVQGLIYQHTDTQPDLEIGNKGRHDATYHLDFEGQPLGSMTLYFDRRRHEAEIETCEDLLGLAFTALRNAVLLAAARQQPAANTNVAHMVTKDNKADALILVALDRFDEIRRDQGDEWADILMSAVHQQLEDGLRDADCVYHIGDDLIAVLLPFTKPDQAQAVARKIRLLIASLHLRNGEVREQLSACMGICAASQAHTAEQVMQHARAALRRAQNTGRNEIVNHE